MRTVRFKERKVFAASTSKIISGGWGYSGKPGGHSIVEGKEVMRPSSWIFGFESTSLQVGK